MRFIFTLFIFYFSGQSWLRAQSVCNSTISFFPYHETFETSAGGWAAGGIASDWALGTPAKSVISSAGEGTRSWVTGGLVNSFYNNGENSYLIGPCFNLSTLTNPIISFKIFWETEKKFDGATMQYSTDGGNVWNLLGNINSNANCANSNWYNNASITYLGNVAGWSGNIQPNNGSCLGGSGSGSWLLAAHELFALAGQPSVRFRFVFGAGTTCNNFDGFGIDDIRIAEQAPSAADFSFSCQPARTVTFENISSCAQSLAWDFDDPSSGALNFSQATDPSHIFSGPGAYNVKLTATFAGGVVSTITKTIRVLGAAVSVVQPIACGGEATGAVMVAASGGNAAYQYFWYTNPLQTTAVIQNIPAGNYSVLVTSTGACAAEGSITLTEPAPLNIAAAVSNAICLSANGMITTNVSGGTAPYTYTWNTGVASPSLVNLSAGNYHVDVADINGCTSSSDFNIQQLNSPLSIDLGRDTFICPGQKLVLNPGNFGSYLWQDQSTGNTFTVSEAGIYKVVVTDLNGCKGSDERKVTVDCSAIYFPTAFTPNGDAKNEFFGPAGSNLFGLFNYRLEIFNRYGETVFLSTDPFKKWDGRYKGILPGNETFVWTAAYTLNGRKDFQKGIVTLIR